MSEPHLVRVAQVWDFSKDEPAFAWNDVLWEYDGDFYYSRWEQRSFNPSPDIKRETFQKATRIPRGYYLGELPSGATATRAASTALSNPNVYFKRVEPFMFDPNRPELNPPALDLIHEMRVCEELSQSLHPNVCRYLGYVPTPDGKHLLGLCFQRHEMDLSSAVKDKVFFDPRAVIDGVRRGLEHLHSLGYAHNDLNPTNVVLDKHALPVIIDFDSCQKFGVSLTDKKAGTIDWEYNSDVSLPQNDFDALAIVRKWLEENYVAL
ncbi:hypothetical protein B0H12DRAFT_805568 [Mycena haematopus]|nr:hypothetical protein B0H12DRAFT_805568 [Mycena haematopus]